jgi:nitrite reductase/ring-hydroxylating ferredoxin subunit
VVSEFVDLGPLSSLAPGAQRNVSVGATRLLLCHEASSGRVWAMREQCPHAFQPLLGGVVQRGTIQCPKHGACFDLATGAPANEVTTRPLPVYPTRIQDGRILVSTLPLSTRTAP